MTTATFSFAAGTAAAADTAETTRTTTAKTKTWLLLFSLSSFPGLRNPAHLHLSAAQSRAKNQSRRRRRRLLNLTKLQKVFLELVDEDRFFVSLAEPIIINNNIINIILT